MVAADLNFILMGGFIVCVRVQAVSGVHALQTSDPPPAPYLHLLASSRAMRTCSLTILDSSRSSARWPPFQALRLTRSLPSSDLGPVDLAHGLQLLISSACRCLRSNVQPLTMICLQ